MRIKKSIKLIFTNFSYQLKVLSVLIYKSKNRRFGYYYLSIDNINKVKKKLAINNGLPKLLKPRLYVCNLLNFRNI